MSEHRHTWHLFTFYPDHAYHFCDCGANLTCPHCGGTVWNYDPFGDNGETFYCLMCRRDLSEYVHTQEAPNA
jgi:hypothetical protein